MRLIDKYGMIYHMLKKDDNYYLATRKFNINTQKYRYHVEVKGKENIRIFIKNNKLTEYKEV